jgi:hypothetical protein
LNDAPDTTTLRPPTLALDQYRQYLDDSNLTEAQANELLAVLWNIMVQFVDLGFGVSTIPKNFDPPSDNMENESADMLSLNSAKRDEEQRRPRHDD